MPIRSTPNTPQLTARETTRRGFRSPFLLLSDAGSRLTGMPAPDGSTPARDAIDAFLRHLADRDLSATTRRIRKTYLNEYLRHAQQATAAADDAGAAEEAAGAPELGEAAPPALTAGDLM